MRRGTSVPTLVMRKDLSHGMPADNCRISRVRSIEAGPHEKQRTADATYDGSLESGRPMQPSRLRVTVARRPGVGRGGHPTGATDSMLATVNSRCASRR